jgi:DNA-binding response OmpR family regulator
MDSPRFSASESIAPLASLTHTILIAEDDDSTRTGLAMLLAGLGYRVLAAGTLAEAKHAVTTDSPDLIIVDVRLGGDNGLQLIALLPRPIPSLVLTGYADPVLEADARALGAPFLLKPCAPPLLIQSVRALLADAPTPAPPTRRWIRTPVSARTAARADGASVRLRDVSYGGASFEIRHNLSDATSLRITFGNTFVAVPFHVCWSRRRADGWYVCGGCVPDPHQPAWRTVVDSLR